MFRSASQGLAGSPRPAAEPGDALLHVRVGGDERVEAWSLARADFTDVLGQYLGLNTHLEDVGTRRLLELRREDDLIDAEFVWVCRDAEYPMLEVPVFSSRRYGGKSTTTLRSAVRMYWGAWALRREGHAP